MAVVPATPENVRRAAEALRSGGVVAFPTETVYGLGANAFDPVAVARVFEIKRRPSFDPLIVHVADEAMLAQVTPGAVGPMARRLIERYWPGPLTLVLPKSERIPGLVTAGLPTVGVRMPANRVARDLLEAAGVPLAAPSANPFGSLSPTRAEHVAAALGNAVDLILDGGPTEHGLESTILALEPSPRVLRPGPIPAEELAALIGPLEAPGGAQAQPIAPGMLDKHYAPRTPLRLVASLEDVPIAERRGAAALALRRAPADYAAVRVLSAGGDLRTAAAHLFEALHELDALGLARIDAEIVPPGGLGTAIADRLQRAARGSAR